MNCSFGQFQSYRAQKCVTFSNMLQCRGIVDVEGFPMGSFDKLSVGQLYVLVILTSILRHL
jgi:hypothetical protein